MKIIAIAAAFALTVAAASQASAGSLINIGGGSSSLISVSPQVSVLNNSNTSVLSGLLSGNKILNGNSILSGNDNNGLLGLGILSGNNNDNSSYGGKTRRCGCR
jgi:hypothetical protein